MQYWILAPLKSKSPLFFHQFKLNSPKIWDQNSHCVHSIFLWQQLYDVFSRVFYTITTLMTVRTKSSIRCFLMMMGHWEVVVSRRLPGAAGTFWKVAILFFDLSETFGKVIKSNNELYHPVIPPLGRFGRSHDAYDNHGLRPGGSQSFYLSEHVIFVGFYGNDNPTFLFRSKKGRWKPRRLCLQGLRIRFYERTQSLGRVGRQVQVPALRRPKVPLQ